LAKPAGRRWRTLGSGPPDRAGHLRQPVQVPTPESMWRLALRGRRQGFCRGRIRRRNGCPVPPIYRRGDARGARSVSGGSAADLGSAPDAV